MAITTKKADRKEVGTAFYVGKITKVELKVVKSWNVLDVTFKPDALKFDIRKSIFLEDDRMWILDLLFEAAKCTPTEVKTGADGKEIRTWEENDLVGKEVQALIYQAQYGEIWEFLATDATEELKSATMKKFQEYLRKKGGGGTAKKDPIMEATPVGANTASNDNDLPF